MSTRREEATKIVARAFADMGQYGGDEPITETDLIQAGVAVEALADAHYVVGVEIDTDHILRALPDGQLRLEKRDYQEPEDFDWWWCHTPTHKFEFKPLMKYGEMWTGYGGAWGPNGIQPLELLVRGNVPIIQAARAEQRAKTIADVAVMIEKFWAGINLNPGCKQVIEHTVTAVRAWIDQT